MKYIYTLLFVAISAISFAQGNLQFNQVINITGGTPGGNVFTTVTVPAGKVWKITTATWMEADGDNIFGNYRSLCIGEFKLSAITGNDAVFPIWLKEGEHDVKYCSISQTSAGGSTPYRYAFSGIEFNIIP